MLERAVRRKTVQRISIPWIHTRDSSQYIFRRIGIVIITVWRSWAAILLARHHILARNSNFRKVSCETAINLWHSATWWTCSSDVWLEHSAASAATTAVPQTLGRGSKGCSVAPGWPTGWEVGKQLLWPHEWHEWYDECMVCHFFRWYHGRPGSGKYHEASWSIMKHHEVETGLKSRVVISQLRQAGTTPPMPHQDRREITDRFWPFLTTLGMFGNCQIFWPLFKT